MPCICKADVRIFLSSPLPSFLTLSFMPFIASDPGHLRWLLLNANVSETNWQPDERPLPASPVPQTGALRRKQSLVPFRSASVQKLPDSFGSRDSRIRQRLAALDT